MLFWILLGILLVFIGIIIWGLITTGIDEGGIGCLLFFVVLLLILVVPVIIKHSTVNVTLAEYQVRKEVIELRLEYLEDIDEESYLLYEGFDTVYTKTFSELQSYNKDVAKKQNMVGNFWVGIWYPEEYEQLELIEIGGQINENN